MFKIAVKTSIAMGHTPHKIIKGRRERNRERRENEKSER